MPIPMVFQNLKGYDGHLLMQVMSRVTGQINTGNAPEDMKITSRMHEDEEKRNPMLRKGIYLYEYMNDFARFEETALPAQEEFYSKLSGKGIT